jgi:predicted metal-binding protein
VATTALSRPIRGDTFAALMLTVLVCRGCCCGTERKHPEVDHAAQLEAIRASAGGRLRVTECLDACDRSNVVVLRDGDSTRWLGGVLAVEQLRALCEWLASGRGGEAMPERLQPLLFEPEESARGCLAALENARDASAAK